MADDKAQRFFMQDCSSEDEDDIEAIEEPAAPTVPTKSTSRVKAHGASVIALDDSDEDAFVKPDADRGASGRGRGRGRGRGGSSSTRRRVQAPLVVVLSDDDDAAAPTVTAGRKRLRAAGGTGRTGTATSTSGTTPDDIAEELFASLDVPKYRAEKKAKNAGSEPAVDSAPAARLKAEKAELRKATKSAITATDHLLTADVDELRLIVEKEERQEAGVGRPEDLGPVLIVKAQFPPSAGIKPIPAKLRMRQTFESMLVALASKLSVRVEALRMRYDGTLVKPHQTPQELDMSAEDENAIDFEVLSLPPPAAPAPAAAAPAAKVTPDVILQLEVRFPTEAAMRPTKVKMKPNQDFKMLLSPLASKLSLTAAQVRLVYRGKDVLPTDTPASIGLRPDGDCTLDVFPV